jgi:hypothetical protein
MFGDGMVSLGTAVVTWDRQERERVREDRVVDLELAVRRGSTRG